MRSQGPRFCMKPDKFSGSTSIDTFLIQFNTCAEYNGWGDRERAAQLKCSLVGSAVQVLWDSESGEHMKYAELVDKFNQSINKFITRHRTEARYGSVGLHERFATELRYRRRRPNETLAEPHSDIRRLMALAYPGTRSWEKKLLGTILLPRWRKETWNLRSVIGTR